MKIIIYPSPEERKALLARPAFNAGQLEKKVADILSEVKRNGDKALLRFAREFDGADLKELAVSQKELSLSEKKISNDLKTAIRRAEKNIRAFHASQQEPVKIIKTEAGISCWRRLVAIEKVGLYIPGGTAPLFSTLLMLGIPSQLAGCKEIVLCTPPGRDGEIPPAILFTAKLLGIQTIYKVGGAQAIAAMAYGTQSIPQVYKIFGPGNQFVTCAKQLVNREGVAIDMPAGPSELAVYADSSCVPAYVAADLLSQAEHGIDSQVILVSTEKKVIAEILNELKKQLALLPRKDIATKALQNSRAFLVRSEKEGMKLLNDYAPEHLILATNKNETMAKQIVNAGSVFLGNYSCESAGDYASGTNHTLPTNGYAKAYSGVSLDSFVKKITFQKLSRNGLLSIGKTIELMAEAEGLYAHKNAVSLRIKK